MRRGGIGDLGIERGNWTQGLDWSSKGVLDALGPNDEGPRIFPSSLGMSCLRRQGK
jgi:hypothetical protein